MFPLTRATCRTLQEALGEVAMASLQHPSGPAQALPDVLGFVRYLQEKRKQQALEDVYPWNWEGVFFLGTLFSGHFEGKPKGK